MSIAYVTGGTGCVGRNIIELLRAKDWEVVAPVRASAHVNRLNDSGARKVLVNLYDPHAAEASIPPGTEVVFHPAASVSHWSGQAKQQRHDNILVTRNLALGALAKGVRRFIFTSTGATNMWPGATRAEAERIPCQYARTKRLAEIELEELQGQGMDIVTLQPPIIVGPWDYNNYSTIFRKFAAGKPPPVLAGEIEFADARAVAAAHLAAVTRGQPGARYQLAGFRATWLAFYQVVARYLGQPPPTRQTSLRTLYLVALVMQTIARFTGRPPLATTQMVTLLRSAGITSAFATQRARADLGYEAPDDLDGMVIACRDWMIAQGILTPPPRGWPAAIVAA